MRFVAKVKTVKPNVSAPVRPKLLSRAPGGFGGTAGSACRTLSVSKSSVARLRGKELEGERLRQCEHQGAASLHTQAYGVEPDGEMLASVLLSHAAWASPFLRRRPAP